MIEKNDNERRQKLRVDFKTNVIVNTAESEISVDGSSKDLSLKGVFVNTKEKIPENTKCYVRVLLSGMTENIALKMQGKVIRKDEAGIAIAFDSMDLDSYTHLKNIVRYNTSDPDIVH